MWYLRGNIFQWNINQTFSKFPSNVFRAQCFTKILKTFLFRLSKMWFWNVMKFLNDDYCLEKSAYVRNRCAYIVERDGGDVRWINLKGVSRCLIKFSLLFSLAYHNSSWSKAKSFFFLGFSQCLREEGNERACLFRLFGLESAHWF